MTSPLEQRADAFYKAIEDMREAGSFLEPLREMESAAVESLPDFDVFLRQWRDLVQEACNAERNHQWDLDSDRWLREAVRRMDKEDPARGNHLLFHAE